MKTLEKLSMSLQCRVPYTGLRSRAIVNRKWNRSEVSRLGEVGVVDGVDDGLSGENFAGEEATIEAFEGIVATCEILKLDKDGALTVLAWDTDVYDLAILVRTFVLEVFLQVLLKVGLLGSARSVKHVEKGKG